MVEDVAEEMKHMDQLELQLQHDRQEQAEPEKKQTDLGGRIEKLEMEEAQPKKLYSEAQDAYESIVRKHSAEDLRKHLQTGEPCPVCDQIVARSCPLAGHWDYNSRMASAVHGSAHSGKVEDIRLLVDTIPGLVWSTQPDGSGEFFN